MKENNKKKPEEWREEKGKREKKDKRKEKKEEKSEEKKNERKKEGEGPKKNPPNWHPTPTSRLVSSCHHHSHPYPPAITTPTRILLPSSKLFPDAPPAIGRTWLWPMNLWSSD